MAMVTGPSRLPPPREVVDRREAGPGRDLCLHIAVTGHIALDPDRLGTLEAGLGRLISSLEGAFPTRTRRLVLSGLALGAARIGLPPLRRAPDTLLGAILAFPPEEFADDFGRSDDPALDPRGAPRREEFRRLLTACSYREIAPPLPTREAAYAWVGDRLVELADVLVAIWDGRAAQGDGGTGAVVARAIAARRTIGHLWAGNAKADPTRRTDVGDRFGRVRWYNLPGLPPGIWVDEPIRP